MKLVEKCPICNSLKLKKLKNYTFKATKRDLKNQTKLGILVKKIMKTDDKAKFIISLCRNCGFIFLNPTYSEEELNQIIRNTEERSKKIKNPRILTKSNKLRKSHEVYKLVKKYFAFNSKHIPKILDFGGRHGYSLIPFVDTFKCYVLDLAKYQLPKGIHYIGNNLKNLNNDKKFDIVIMLHTLEHVHNPSEILDETFSHLNENGIVIIQVPLGCLRDWKALYQPYYHINFFSEQSLYNCIRLSKLQVLHMKTEFVKVGSYKIWQLTAVATKRKKGPFKSISTVLSTDLQRKLSLLYYFPLLFRRGYIHLIVMKKRLKSKVSDLLNTN